MRKSILVLLVISISTMVAGNEGRVVSACTCAGTTPEEALRRSEVVFIGRVAKTDHPSWVEWLVGSYAPGVIFEVSEAWKGTISGTIVVGSGEVCGYPFDEGRYYLVYASEWEGRLQTGLCSGTKSLSSAREDIAALNLLSTPIGPEHRPGPTFPSMESILLSAVALFLSTSLLLHLKRTGRINAMRRLLSQRPKTKGVLLLLTTMSLGLVAVHMLMPSLMVRAWNTLPLACPTHRPVPVLSAEDATEIVRGVYSSSQERWDIGRPIPYAYCNGFAEGWYQGSWGHISDEGVPDAVESYAYEFKANLALYRVLACSNDTGLREEVWVDGTKGKPIARVPTEVPSGISSCDLFWAFQQRLSR